MPTGYTAKLMDTGESFESFVMHCARAFGALVMMRDDSMDAPIPKFEPSPHYTKSLAEHHANLERLQVMSGAERVAHGEAAQAKHVAMLETWLTKDKAQNARLAQMRADVLAWTPPTAEHVGLKDFMLEQLQTSENNLDYITKEISKAKSQSALGYWTAEVASESRGVEYATEELAKEIDRTRGRNLWVEQLRESLTAQVK